MCVRAFQNLSKLKLTVEQGWIGLALGSESKKSFRSGKEKWRRVSATGGREEQPVRNCHSKRNKI